MSPAHVVLINNVSENFHEWLDQWSKNYGIIERVFQDILSIKFSCGHFTGKVEVGPEYDTIKR